MTEEKEIPEPDSSGSSGTQTADSKVELLPAKWQGESPVSDTVEGLVADRSRVFGSEATGALLAASMRQTENDKRQLTNRIIDLDEKVESLRNDLESERIENAKLQGRLGGVLN